jgi:hypothetical protein
VLPSTRVRPSKGYNLRDKARGRAALVVLLALIATVAYGAANIDKVREMLVAPIVDVQPVDSAPQTAPSEQVLDEEVSVRTPVPTLATLTETVSRPVFAATRRAFVPPKPVQRATPVKKPTPATLTVRRYDFQLTAILIVDDTPIALIRHPKTNTVLKLKEGDVALEWTVRTIMADSVVLANGTETQTIALREFSSSTSDPTRPPPRRSNTAGVATTNPSASTTPPANTTTPATTNPRVVRPKRPLRGPRLKLRENTD